MSYLVFVENDDDDDYEDDDDDDDDGNDDDDDGDDDDNNGDVNTTGKMRKPRADGKQLFKLSILYKFNSNRVPLILKL